MSDTPGVGAPPSEIVSALIAHELRTPVAAFLGYLEVLQDEAIQRNPEALRQGLRVAHERATQLARVVGRLGTYAEQTSGAPLMRPPTTATLGDVVEELVARDLADVDATAEALAAAVDGERVRLILSELLDNAARFGAPRSATVLHAGVEGEPPHLTIRVASAGEPIPAELRTAIFDPFRQAELHLTRHHGGLGLGLAMARRAAEAAGGALLLEAGEPTTFRIDMPLRADELTLGTQTLDRRAAHAEAQAMMAIRALQRLRTDNEKERAARALAVQEQLKAVEDFRSAHREAVELAGRLDGAYLEIITALAKAVEVRDEYTGSHVERVCKYSMQIAEQLQMTPEAQRPLEFGAVLHDVGKIGVSDAILGKPGPLDDDEWAMMRRHPEIGQDLLEGISFLAPALDAVACHHERWDGRGYPRRLVGEEIPLAGRIVAVADAFDAMTTDRPYRRGLPVEVALGELRRGKGASFDPNIVDAFVQAQARAA